MSADPQDFADDYADDQRRRRPITQLALMVAVPNALASTRDDTVDAMQAGVIAARCADIVRAMRPHD